MIRMIGVLCLTFTFSAATVAFERSPEAEAAREALRADPDLVEAFAQWGVSLEAWEAGLRCHLLNRDHPTSIRFNAIQAVALSEQRTGPVVCGQDDAAVKVDALSRAILQDGWNDPALLSQAFWTACVRPKSPDWCDAAVMYDRLQQIDPDNAAVILIPLLTDVDLGDPALRTSEGAAALIASAANAEKFDLYWWASVGEAWQVIADYETAHPAPRAPQRLESAFEAAQTATSDPVVLAAMNYGLIQTARQLPWTEPIMETCSGAISDSTASLRTDCLKLASLLQGSNTMIAQMAGESLPSRMARADRQDSDDSETDPWASNRWLRMVGVLARDCRRTRVLHQFDAAFPMPRSHYATYYHDLGLDGESAATQRAAQREYAVYPEFYPMNPADCDAILELDEEALKEVVGLYMSNGRSDRYAALTVLGEWVSE